MRKKIHFQLVKKRPHFGGFLKAQKILIRCLVVPPLACLTVQLVIFFSISSHGKLKSENSDVVVLTFVFKLPLSYCRNCKSQWLVLQQGRVNCRKVVFLGTTTQRKEFNCETSNDSEISIGPEQKGISKRLQT